jgi:hypothetical protein
MRCWQCGVEPESVHEITTLSDPERKFMAGRWPPATDHEHAHRPPTPEELERAADALLQERFRVL